MQIDRSVAANRSVATTIGGVQQVIYNREDVFWDITTSEVDMSVVKNFQFMLSAILEGTTALLDPYDIGEFVSCVMTADKYAAARIDTSDYFTVTFRLKEI